MAKEGRRTCRTSHWTVCLTTSGNGAPNSKRDGSWRSCWIGTGARKRPSGGNTSGFATCRRKTCFMSGPAWRTSRSCSRPAAPPWRPMHRYRFALQDTDIRAEDDLRSIGGDKFGRVVGHFARRSHDRHQEARRHGRPSSRGGLRPQLRRYPGACRLADADRRIRGGPRNGRARAIIARPATF